MIVLIQLTCAVPTNCGANLATVAYQNKIITLQLSSYHTYIINLHSVPI